MKKLLTVKLVLVMLLSLFLSLAAAEDEHQPISIRIFWWGNTARHEKYKQYEEGEKLQAEKDKLLQRIESAKQSRETPRNSPLGFTDKPIQPKNEKVSPSSP